MSWCHGGVGIVIYTDIGIMEVHSTVPCESCIISKQDVSYKLCLQCILREAIGKTPLAGCGMGKVIVHWEFSRQRQHWYLQQLHFFTHKLVLGSSSILFNKACNPFLTLCICIIIIVPLIKFQILWARILMDAVRFNSAVHLCVQIIYPIWNQSRMMFEVGGSGSAPPTTYYFLFRSNVQALVWYLS
jgi:hypothetical protein